MRGGGAGREEQKRQVQQRGPGAKSGGSREPMVKMAGFYRNEELEEGKGRLDLGLETFRVGRRVEVLGGALSLVSLGLDTRNIES